MSDFTPVPAVVGGLLIGGSACFSFYSMAGSLVSAALLAGSSSRKWAIWAGVWPLSPGCCWRL